MKYICIRGFEFYNDYSDDNEIFTVKKGTVWETGSDNFVGADVHLDSEDGSWIEISQADLDKCFKSLEGDE